VKNSSVAHRLSNPGVND